MSECGENVIDPKRLNGELVKTVQSMRGSLLKLCLCSSLPYSLSDCSSIALGLKITFSFPEQNSRRSGKSYFFFPRLARYAIAA